MKIPVLNGFRNLWNVFKGSEDNAPSEAVGPVYSQPPGRPRITSASSEKTIVAAIYNRLALDCSALPFYHVRVDEEERFQEVIRSPLNDCLTLSANIDQTGRQFIQDAVISLLDEGGIALVPVEVSGDPNRTSGYVIYNLRVAKIVGWQNTHCMVDLYDERQGIHKQLPVRKDFVAIIENPFYTVMNASNSTLNRLILKLNLLDAIDKQSGSGKLDLLVQLPFALRSDQRKKEADARKLAIENQLFESKYGIAYIDATERVTQLNRPVENQLLKQIEFLMDMLYGQLGLTAAVMNGTADEKVMLNYYVRSIEPIASALALSMTRSFLSKTARSQGQRIMFFRDPFRLMSVQLISELADKLTRSKIVTANEFRGVLGLTPKDDPDADTLSNPNLNKSENQPVQSEEQASPIQEDQNGREAKKL
jgi:hypothetical protein